MESGNNRIVREFEANERSWAEKLRDYVINTEDPKLEHFLHNKTRICYCGKFLVDVESWREHKSDHNRRVYECPWCLIVMDDKNNMKIHLTKTHQPPATPGYVHDLHEIQAIAETHDVVRMTMDPPLTPGVQILGMANTLDTAPIHRERELEYGDALVNEHGVLLDYDAGGTQIFRGDKGYIRSFYKDYKQFSSLMVSEKLRYAWHNRLNKQHNYFNKEYTRYIGSDFFDTVNDFSTTPEGKYAAEKIRNVVPPGSVVRIGLASTPGGREAGNKVHAKVVGRNGTVRVVGTYVPIAYYREAGYGAIAEKATILELLRTGTENNFVVNWEKIGLEGNHMKRVGEKEIYFELYIYHMLLEDWIKLSQKDQEFFAKPMSFARCKPEYLTYKDQSVWKDDLTFTVHRANSRRVHREYIRLMRQHRRNLSLDAYPAPANNDNELGVEMEEEGDEEE